MTIIANHINTMFSGFEISSITNVKNEQVENQKRITGRVPRSLKEHLI